MVLPEGAQGAELACTGGETVVARGTDFRVHRSQGSGGTIVDFCPSGVALYRQGMLRAQFQAGAVAFAARQVLGEGQQVGVLRVRREGQSPVRTRGDTYPANAARADLQGP